MNKEQKDQHYLFSLVYPIYRSFQQKISFHDWINQNFPDLTTLLPNQQIEKQIELYEKILLLSAGITNTQNTNTSAHFLKNIFSVIHHNSQNQSPLFKPSPLNLNILDNISFDTIKQNQSTELLLSDLKNLFQHAASSSSLSTIANNTLFLIQKHTSFSPSPFTNEVSFFNHVKTASGIYNSLIDSDNDNIIMLGGDISGIQSYIYDILNKKAARNLKGRSFYLQLLSDSIVSFILRETNNFQTNILYSSGGGFYLFLPSNKEIKSQLQNEIIPTIQQNLFQHHKTSFFIAIDFIEFKPFRQSKISELWQQLTEKISAKKRTPFFENIKQNYDKFFEPKENILIDEFSAEPLDPNNSFVFDIEKNSFSEYNKTPYNPNKHLLTSPANKTVIELAPKLSNAKFILKFNKPNDNTISVCDLTYIQPVASIKQLTPNNLPEEIYIINPDFNTQINLPYLDTVKYTIYFYGGNDYPKDQNQNDIKDFSELVDEKQGFNRLGILRMDVDNLGSLFTSGLPSFAHYSTISYFLDMFFKYHLNFIWNSKPEYKTHISIIYSGGDDLFLVGNWTNIIDFAINIHQKFSKWTNNTLTLSAGISIVRNKFPILKSALLAQEEEDNAKQHKYDNTEKNAISFMNFPLSFNTELSMVTELKEQIKSHLQNKTLSKSLIYKIYFYEEMYKQKYLPENQKDNIAKHKWKWLMAYDFYRNKNKQNQDLLENILQNTLKNDNENSKYHYIELLTFATKWAELESRKN